MKKRFRNEIDFNSRFDHANANYQKVMPRDKERLENRLVLFCLLDHKFYKLAYLDQRALRFEAWGERLTRILHFKEAILFDYTNQDKFEELYELYLKNFKIELSVKTPRTKEYLLSWFEEYEGNISFLPEQQEKINKKNKDSNS